MAVAAPELVRVLLGPSWQLAASILPWFALAAAMSVLSRFSQALAESRAELGRSLLVQCVYIAILSLLLLLVAYDLQAKGLWLFAAAVAVGEFCRFAAYLHLTRRLLRLVTVDVIRSLLPGLFAAAIVGLALGLVRITLSSEISSPFALLAAEFLVGIFAYAMGVRVWPLPDGRRELWSRASTFGVLGRVGRWRWRLALLVLGSPPLPTGTQVMRLVYGSYSLPHPCFCRCPYRLFASSSHSEPVHRVDPGGRVLRESKSHRYFQVVSR